MAAFDPFSLGGSHKVKVWAPGRRIRLVRRSGWGALVGLVLTMGAAGGLAFALYATFGPIPAAALAAVVGLTLWLAFQPQAVEYDWESRRWSFTSSIGRVRVDAADVKHIEVDTAVKDKNIYRYRHGYGPGEIHQHAPEHRRTTVLIERPNAYVGVVHLVYEVRENRKKPKLQRQLIWASPEGADEVSRYPIAVPFAEELARVLGHSCRVVRPEGEASEMSRAGTSRRM